MDKDKTKVYWDFENGIFYSKEFLINNINAKGRIEEQKLRNTLSINSKLLQLKSDLLYDFSKEIPAITLLANINRWDLNKLDLNLEIINKNLGNHFLKSTRKKIK